VRVLVLGSNGFIGARFVKMFSDRYEIVAESFDGSQPDHDCARYDAAISIIDGCKPAVIVNMAGKSYHTAANDADIYESNMLIQLNVHEACARLRVHPTIILCSSGAVYASSREPVDEHAPCEPVNTYAKAKYMQERIALSYHPEQHVVIARLFNVIGPFQNRDFFIPSLIDRLVRFKKKEAATVPLKTLNAMRDFVHVSDVCDALGTLIEKGAPGEAYNVCSGIGVPIQQVIDNVVRMLELSDVVLDVREDHVKDGIGYQVGSNKKLLKLGWTPQHTIGDSLAAIIREEYGS
jgi:nucleoside-diphosphate-sugar epimerase